jgi:hypothetical protein
MRAEENSSPLWGGIGNLGGYIMHKLLPAAFGAMLAAIAIVPTTAEAKPPYLSGNWNIYTCLNPDRVCGLAYCARFTKAAGTVNGMQISGTWTSDGPGVTDGRWVQNGDIVQIFSPYSSGAYFVTLVGTLNGVKRIGGISWTDESTTVSDPLTGTWYAEKRASACPAPAASQSSNGRRIGAPQ